MIVNLQSNDFATKIRRIVTSIYFDGLSVEMMLKMTILSVYQ